MGEGQPGPASLPRTTEVCRKVEEDAEDRGAFTPSPPGALGPCGAGGPTLGKHLQGRAAGTGSLLDPSGHQQGGVGSGF